MEQDQDQKWIEKLLSFVADSDEVNNTLSSNLVEYLVHKGVIDIDDYLKFIESKKMDYLARLSSAGYASDSQLVSLVNKWYIMQINDFKKD